MCLSTTDDIEYEPTVLKTMTTDQLLYQLVCLQHLTQPKREGQLKAKAFAMQIIASTNDFIAQVADLGVPHLTESLKAGLEAYKAEIDLE